MVYENWFYIIQIYSGITSGSVLNGELLYTAILEVNLFAFACILYQFLACILVTSGSYKIWKSPCEINCLNQHNDKEDKHKNWYILWAMFILSVDVILHAGWHFHACYLTWHHQCALKKKQRSFKMNSSILSWSECARNLYFELLQYTFSCLDHIMSLINKNVSSWLS